MNQKDVNEFILESYVDGSLTLKVAEATQNDYQSLKQIFLDKNDKYQIAVLVFDHVSNDEKRPYGFRALITYKPIGEIIWSDFKELVFKSESSQTAIMFQLGLSLFIDNFVKSDIESELDYLIKICDYEGDMMLSFQKFRGKENYNTIHYTELTERLALYNQGYISKSFSSILNSNTIAKEKAMMLYSHLFTSVNSDIKHVWVGVDKKYQATVLLNYKTKRNHSSRFYLKQYREVKPSQYSPIKLTFISYEPEYINEVSQILGSLIESQVESDGDYLDYHEDSETTGLIESLDKLAKRMLAYSRDGKYIKTDQAVVKQVSELVKTLTTK